MSKEVWIIGVHPPCPRCDLLRQRIERLANEIEVPVKVKKLSYTDQEAREFAASVGKETGTAKDVVTRTGIDIDWNRLSQINDHPPSHPEDIGLINGPAKRWSNEFDEVLRPCQEKAESVGLLMTPIVVVDGEVKHSGSVPSIEQLRSWMI